MEKIEFSDSVHIYRLKLGMSEFKDELLELCYKIINDQPDVKSDGFGYNMISNNINFIGEVDIKNKLDEVIQKGIDSCIEIYKTKNIDYNIINTDGWVNIVRAKDPVQSNFKDGYEKYHVHTDINKTMGTFEPTFTYVYYVQMPDNLTGEDGTLAFKDKSDREFSILPEEDDLIIMMGDVPHSPNRADNSTKDRIVFAGNVGFGNVKKEKSLI